MSLAQDITRRLGGDWHGTYGAVPGPGHSRHDRSLTIRDHSSNPEDVFIKSFAGDDELAIKQEWRRQGLLPRASRLSTIRPSSRVRVRAAVAYPAAAEAHGVTAKRVLDLHRWPIFLAGKDGQ